MATGIEWTDESWNPVIGCSKVSPGCANCYAERMAMRLASIEKTAPHYAPCVWDESADKNSGWNGKTVFVPDAIKKPLHWRTPRRVFVCSMGDLFHGTVPFEWIDRIFAVMALCPQHTFQILTKRPERMKEYFDFLLSGNRKLGEALRHLAVDSIAARFMIAKAFGVQPGSDGNPPYKQFPNVWIGVTAEDQQRADERIPVLLEIPAAVRFVSIEPVLEGVDIRRFVYNSKKYYMAKCGCGWMGSSEYCLLHGEDNPVCPECYSNQLLDLDDLCLDWVIVGCETGPGARIDAETNKDILRIVDQCHSAGVPVFVKKTAALAKFGHWTWTKKGDPQPDWAVRQWPGVLNAG